MTRRIVITFLLLAVPALFAACGDDDDSAGASDDKIQVITTLPLFADFVREIGGDRVEVTSLLPLGADPHTFEPSPRDVDRIGDADIAFANGLDLEPGLIGVLEANLDEGAELIELGEETVESPLDPSFDPAIAESDPHLWMNYQLGNRYANMTMTKLNLLDPENAGEYKENYNRYGLAIADLGTYFAEQTSAIAKENRKLVTAHEAFDWFAAAIGFEAVAAVAESPGEEPSPSELAELTSAISEQNIPAVFGEPQISEESEILKQAAEDAGVEVCTLYSDSLDDEVSTYIEMMRFNADELARCLGAQ
jgi:ABC-type Zn uptake system ZnuABC Zn-binding protein ZnuA